MADSFVKHRMNLFLASSLLILFIVITISAIWIQKLHAIEGHVSDMYAGSLVRTMEDYLGPSFHNQTGYNIVGEGKGSIQISNLIIDGFRKPDIFVSADALPILRLINHDPPLAHWLVKFASAELVIAFNPKSPFVPELKKAASGEIPWYKVLEEKGFKFRRTDPELDPKGYYTVIAAKLANIYYNDSTIENKIPGDDRNPEQIFPEEVLRSILESGQIDAIVAYKHEAMSSDLPYITLPSQINLGDPKYSDFYNRASYNNYHSNKTIIGNPIYFTYTIPTTVRNPNGAISFANFLLSPHGKIILNNLGLNPIKAVIEGDIKSFPSGTRSLIR